MAYSPEMVMLLQQLRSRILAEFGVKIRLVDPDLLFALGDMGKKSRDPFTRKTVKELMALGGIAYNLDDEKRAAPAATAKTEDVTEITYRGRKIYKQANPASSGLHIPESSTPKVAKQMYRGQVVNK